MTDLEQKINAALEMIAVLQKLHTQDTYRISDLECELCFIRDENPTLRTLPRPIDY